MIINREFVDKVLSRSHDLFKFRGLLKYYPGRELSEENTRIFINHKQFMEFLAKNVPWNDEYYVICQRRSEISFRFKDEAMNFSMDESGKFKILNYDNLLVDRSKIQLDRSKLIEELKTLIVFMYSRHNAQKKVP